ncbi:MAG: Fe-S cluster assembly protein IscX [Alphaproteobacteria bacterium]
MKITWEDYDKIADALAERYQEVDLVNITDDEVIELVHSLEDFEGTDRPEDMDVIDAIVNLWAQIADGTGYDDSMFDAYA